MEIQEEYKKIGEEEGRGIGADNAFVKSIKSLMKNTQKSYEEACSILEIKESDMLRYKKMI